MSPKSKAKTKCMNCGCLLKGDYCHQCGQHSHIDSDPSLHDIIHELIHEFSHLNDKIFQTLKVLFLRPGELTREFLQGRRASYIGPVRLYLTMSIAYFLIAATSATKAEKSAIKNIAEKQKIEDAKKIT